MRSEKSEPDVTMEDVPRLALRAREAAQALAISPRKLWALTKRNEIPHARLGKVLIYPVEALRLYLWRRLEAPALCDNTGRAPIQRGREGEAARPQRRAVS